MENAKNKPFRYESAKNITFWYFSIRRFKLTTVTSPYSRTFSHNYMGRNILHRAFSPQIAKLVANNPNLAQPNLPNQNYSSLKH